MPCPPRAALAAAFAMVFAITRILVAAPASPGTVIYTGGDILTMRGPQPELV